MSPEQGPPPRPLDYRAPSSPGSGAPTPSVASQVVLGVLLWIFNCIVAGMIGSELRSMRIGIAVLITGASLLLAIGVVNRIKLGMKGFIPGVLLGFGLTCLLPLGIASVFCGKI